MIPLLLLAACDDTGTDPAVLSLAECPMDAPCNLVADGASHFSMKACIADSVDTPWRSGQADAPASLELVLSSVGATFPDGTDNAKRSLDAKERCATETLVAGTAKDVLITGTYLGTTEDLQITLVPADVEQVYIETSPWYLAAGAITELTLTAHVAGLGDADVSDGTRVAFTVTPDPITVGYTLSPSEAYVADGLVTSKLVVLPGATSVTVTATATPPTWSGSSGAESTSTPLVVYASPG